MGLKRHNTTHTVDFIFTLSLFCIFAASSLLVVSIGAKIYSKTTSTMEDTYSARTALAYVTEKIRQHDIAGHISLTKLYDVNTLVLTNHINGEQYLTYIYPYENYLCELTIQEGITPARDMGEKIIEISDFSISETTNGFLEFHATAGSGTSITLFLHLRSEFV